MIDTNNWKINTASLKNYKKSEWTQDYFKETFDEKYGVYIYNIDEWRMMSYAGIIGLFEYKAEPRLILNSTKTWVWFDNDKTFDYLPLSDCLIFIKPAFKERSPKGAFPFLLIKRDENIFAFIEWDATSTYYRLKELSKDKIKIIERADEIRTSDNSKRTNEEFNLSTLNWYDLKQFDNALEVYHSRP